MTVLPSPRPSTDQIGAGAPEDKIEITPAMERAGTEAICAFDRRFGEIEDLAAEVYEAMERIKRKEAAYLPDHKP
jgi:hypothetical protein